MGNKFYIAVILSLSVTLLGYFFDYFGELVFGIFPFIAFIYMAFSFDMPRLDFNLMWVVLIFPFVFFLINDISFMIFGFVYQFIYLAILILFNVGKKKSEENGGLKDKDNFNNWSMGKFLKVVVPIIFILVGILLFVFFGWLMFAW